MRRRRAQAGTRRRSIAVLGGWFCLSAILFAGALAAAQETINPPPADNPGFFASIGRWLDERAAAIGENLRGAAGRIENLSQQAGQGASVAAKSTAATVKDAAGAVIRMPTTRLISGHETCSLAPNGAPDCVAAANALCQAKGFASGTSADMTTAEVCKPEVYLAGRSSGEGCHTETFVSRAFCQ